jgi:hypothetical protein
MSQNDFTLANQGFPSMRADMNSAFQALASNNSGATAPTTTFAHQWWYDTTSSLLMIRNAGNTAWEEFSAGGGIVYVEKTANYTAAAGEGIIANTSSGSWTLTLPATPASGDVVVIADGADWATNNLTVDRNGNTIEGDSSNLILNIGGVSVTFIYASNNWQIYTQMGAASGTVVTTTAAQTLTNKTIGSSQLTGALPALDGSALTGISGAAQTVEVFTSSGTYTKPSGLVAVKVTVVAGGGGGAFLNNTSVNTGGGGGGGGGTSIRIIPAATLGATETVTVGAGGTPNATGGTSSFGTLSTATGGATGGSSTGLTSSTGGNDGGLGGVGSSGDLNLHGEVGGMGHVFTTSGANNSVGGNGGNSTMGGGALGVFGLGTNGANGRDAVGYGGGGSGKRSRNTSTSYSGGSGFAGVVVVEEMF